MSDELDKVVEQLSKYGDKNFVQRMFSPEIYGDVPSGQGDGKTSTHKMRVDPLIIDGKEVQSMFPTIFWKDGHFIDLSGDDNIEAAKKYAVESGEYIPFDKFEDADWLERNWKTLWGEKPRTGK